MMLLERRAILATATVSLGLVAGITIAIRPQAWPLFLAGLCLPLLARFPEIGLWFVLLDAWLLNRLTFSVGGALTSTSIAFWAWGIGTLGAVALQHRRLGLWRSPLNYVVVSFFGLIAVSFVARVGSFNVEIVYNVVFYFALLVAMRSRTDLDRFLAVAALGSVILVVLAVASWVFGGMGAGGITGFTSNHVQQAVYIVAGIPSMYYIVYTRRGVVRVLFAVAILVGIAAVFASLSRGALVTMMVCLGIGLLILRGRRSTAAYWLLGLALTATLLPSRLWSRVASIEGLVGIWSKSTEQANVVLSGRGTLYVAAWRMFRSHPLVGVGYGAFRDTWSRYVDASLAGSLAGLEISAHSTYLQILAELGLAGIVLYVGMVAFALWNCVVAYRDALRRMDRRRVIAAASIGISILVFVIHGVLDNSGWHDRVFYFYLATSVVVAGLGGPSARAGRNRTS
jgi:O-antigen ligase